MYKCLNIAKYIVNKCIDDEEPINLLQLTVILFILRNLYYQIQHKSLYKDNDFQKWDIGWVNKEVWGLYKGYGALPIRYDRYKLEETIYKKDKQIIDTVIERLRNYTTSELKQLSEYNYNEY